MFPYQTPLIFLVSFYSVFSFSLSSPVCSSCSPPFHLSICLLFSLTSLHLFLFPSSSSTSSSFPECRVCFWLAFSCKLKLWLNKHCVSVLGSMSRLPPLRYRYKLAHIRSCTSKTRHIYIERHIQTKHKTYTNKQQICRGRNTNYSTMW